jgi:hypothetical protein
MNADVRHRGGETWPPDPPPISSTSPDDEASEGAGVVGFPARGVLEELELGADVEEGPPCYPACRMLEERFPPPDATSVAH